MSAEQHRAEARASKEPIRVAIVVISSTRTPATDQSGVRIAELLVSGGCTVGERLFVDDEIEAIRRAVTGLSSEDVPAVILTGGTGLSGRDVTPEALAPLLHPVLDGFGELFRQLSFQQIGAAAMLSRAVAGLCGRTVIFALPGSVAACELALERLVLPELGHAVHLARKERQPPTPAGDIVDVEFDPVSTGPASTGPASTSPASIDSGSPARDAGARADLGGSKLTLSAIPSPDAPPPAVDTDVGWLRTLTLWGAEVIKDIREPMPEEIERIAPVHEILYRAGDFGTLVMKDGRRFALFGYPDLVRPSAKVLAVRCSGAAIHVLAVHRWPSATGTCVEGDSDPTPGIEQSSASVAERITGRAPGGESPGPLFAVSGDTVWFARGRKVVRFDGRRESDQGTPNQALASLMLEWSQR